MLNLVLSDFDVFEFIICILSPFYQHNLDSLEEVELEKASLLWLVMSSPHPLKVRLVVLVERESPLLLQCRHHPEHLVPPDSLHQKYCTGEEGSVCAQCSKPNEQFSEYNKGHS